MLREVTTSPTAIMATTVVRGGVKMSTSARGIDLSGRARRWRLAGAGKHCQRWWCRWKLTIKKATTAALVVVMGMGL